MRQYEYPVNERHSTVLGYTATSQYGKMVWQELDWRGVWKDRGIHIFNPEGGEYLHVRVKHDSEIDGPIPLENGRWYRVRCRHEIGTKWRGGTVRYVKAVKRSRRWMWIVIVG